MHASMKKKVYKVTVSLLSIFRADKHVGLSVDLNQGT